MNKFLWNVEIYLFKVELVSDDSFFDEQADIIIADVLTSAQFRQCIKLIEVDEPHIL